MSLSKTQRLIAILGALILIISLIVLVVASLPAEREQLVDPIKPDDLASPTPEANNTRPMRFFCLQIGVFVSG